MAHLHHPLPWSALSDYHKDESEGWKEPEAERDYSEHCLLGTTGLWAPMNSEQLWSPGQDQAGQHSSMERRDNKQERDHRIGILNIL